MIPQPTGLTLVEWADASVLELSRYDNIERLDDGDWRRWGEQLNLSLSLSGLNLPDPAGFGEWYDWAQRLCEELT